MKAKKSYLGKTLLLLGALFAFLVVSAEPSYARKHNGDRKNKVKSTPATQRAKPTPTPKPAPAQGSQVGKSCDAVAADADQCYQFFGTNCFSGFAAFLPGLDCTGAPACDSNFGAAAGTDNFKFVFSPAARFTENSDGTATLTGHLESLLQPGFGFDVAVTFTGLTTDPAGAGCAGNPLLELCQNCYINGAATQGTFEPPLADRPPCASTGSVDPTTWHYYTHFTGTLTGTGSYAGLILTISDTMHCFEVGTGASGKNVLPGASGWFVWSVAQNTTGRCVNSSSQAGRFGDFNLNLNCPIGCTLTQGFWKNHPTAWPVTSLTIGGVTYTEAQLITILKTPPAGGDATYILIHQLIAAELNVANGADSSTIAATITAADNYLAAHPLGSNPPEPAHSQGTSLADTLDKYNSGITGPGHCPE